MMVPKNVVPRNISHLHPNHQTSTAVVMKWMVVPKNVDPKKLPEIFLIFDNNANDNGRKIN